MNEGDNATLDSFVGAGAEADGDADADTTDGAATDEVVAEARAVADGEGHVGGVVDPEAARYPAADEHLELAVTQVDYTVEQGADEYPVVHVFGRTSDGVAEHVRVLGVEPYFYVPTAVLADRDPAETFDAVVAVRREDPDGEPFESIRGTPVAKVVTRTPRDVGQIRDEFERTFEADVLFPNRFLVDRDIAGGMRVPARRLEDGTVQVPVDETEPADVAADLRVNVFDIEVDDRSGFPEDGEEPIVCLTSHDSRRDEYVAWHYRAPDGDGRTVDGLPPEDRLDPDAEVRVESFAEETAMLEAFLEYVAETDPDVLTGWNFEDFDAPYLLDRLEVLGLDPDRLSRVDEVWRSGWGGPDIKGRVVFDLLYAYQRTKRSELDSYRLDDVGAVELGVGKERYEGDLGDLWETDPETLLAYNVRDVELCVELDRQQAIVDFWNEARRVVGCRLEDATTPGDAVDMYVLHKAAGEFALPSKGQQETEDFEGGAVFDPITGVRENVAVLDLKCFSGDTDVMTPTGLRNIQELEVGDDIYSLDPDSLEVEVTSVAETHDYENSFGELHHLDGNTHDLKVTENHRFLVSDERGWDEQSPEDFEFVEYGDIPEYERFAFPQHEPLPGESPSTFDLAGAVDGGHVAVYAEDLRAFRGRVPDSLVEDLDLARGSSAAMGLQQKVGKYLIALDRYREHRAAVDAAADELFLKYDRGHGEIPVEIGMTDWLELLGWYVTEGSTDRSAGRFTLHQSDASGRAALTELLDRIGIEYSVDDRGINVSNRHLVEWLEANCGDRAERKRLPEWVFDLDGELSRVLLDTLVRGDGRVTDSNLQKFWTSSTRLKTDVARLAVRCGEKPTVSRQDDGTWYVSIGKRGSFKKSVSGTTEAHDGRVYCVTTEENHVVLAGRNGNLQWVGQSLYPMSMVTINASPETKVDPAEYDGETYRTPTGVHFRAEPDGIIREMVDELLTEREEKKAARDEYDPGSEDYERFDRQQQAVKVIMNSLYGVFGWDRFRLYDREMSAGVTSTNREVISFTEDVAGELGYEVVYGDSVTGDRPVVVRDPGGQVQVIPIADLFDRGEPTPELLIAADGGVVSEATPGKDRRHLDGWEALSVSEDGTAEWQPIEAAIRHETEKPVVRLQHKFGESTTTRDHSYVVEGDEGLVEQRPGAVDAPMRVPDVPEVEEEERVDVYETLAGYTRTHEDGRSVGADDAVEKVKRVHTDGDRVWFGQEHHGDLDSTVTVKREIDLDGPDGRALVRLLAAYVTEGSASTVETTDSLFGASIAESRREWLEGLQADYHRLFEGTTAGIVEPTDGEPRTVEYETSDGPSSTTYHDGTRKLQMMNELAAVFFREFAGQTSRGKRLPSLVYHLPDDLQTLFLETLVEGDGSRAFPRYSEEYAEQHFDFETTSRELAAGLSMLLTQRGRKHSLKYRDETDSYTIRTCGFYREGRDPVLTEVEHDGAVYDLSVAENGNFVDGVGGIVLHNTDSVMLEMGEGLETDKVIDAAFDVAAHINDRYDEFAREELGATEHRFEIEFEKLYRRFFQAGKKKRYAGHIVWKEGADVDDVDITGFEYKRSDIAPITKEVQREVIERIVHGEDVADIREYVHEVVQEFQAGNVDVEAVGIPGGIGKRLDNYDTDTAHVRGAKYANLLLGTNFGRGSKPKRLYLDRVHPEFLEAVDQSAFDERERALFDEFRRDPDVICIEYADQLPEGLEVDWETMLEKTLKGPIERVLEALDVTWEEVRSGQTQTGLGSFT